MALKLGQKIKAVVGAVAPVLARNMGGPLGGLVANGIEKALGVEETASESELLNIINTDPQALERIKQAESDFVARMRELDIDEERLHQGDRADAREREEKTADKTPRNLAYLYTTAFFGLLGAQFYLVAAQVLIDPNALRILDAATGTLFAMVLASKDYYFGSSVGSKMKTLLMRKEN